MANIERANIITRWTCEHLTLTDDSGAIEMWLKKPATVVTDPHTAGKRQAEEADWKYALQVLAKKVLDLDDPATYDYPDHLEALRICWECGDKLPSNRVTKFRIKHDTPKQDTSELQDILDRLESEAVYYCRGCSEFIDESDLVEIRECPQCEEAFDGADGRNCPICNRPFTRKLAEMGCRDCLDEENLPEPTTEEIVREMMNETTVHLLPLREDVS